MARRARAIAIRLGCKGIRHGEYVKKPTPVLATVHVVLTQQCAMRPEELKKNAARSVMHSFVVEESAPGYAELGLYWHDGLGKKVTLGKYAEEHARWRAAEAEAQERRRRAAALDATNSMLHAEFGDDDWAMEECSTEDMEPEAMYSAPFDPNTLYVHYDAAALQECLSAWGSDEPQRKATATALSNLIVKVESTAGTSDDSELEKLRGWRSTDLKRGIESRRSSKPHWALPRWTGR